MKILKIFGVVVGIHLFALILIFANPGCSSTSKPAPAPSDTVAPNDATVSVPIAPPPAGAAPIAFNPDAPAVAASDSGSGGGIRFIPTRPGTPAASTLVTAPVSDVTPATTYTVRAGDTLWELGKKFGVPYAQIAAANNIKASAALHAGQKLIIPGKTASASPAPAATAPAAAPATPAPKAAAASGSTMKHTVKSGETLGSIARKYGVKQGDIAVANNITDPARQVKANMELIIPGWNSTGGNGTKSPAASTPRSTAVEAPAPATPAPAPKPVFNILDGAPSTPAPSTGGDVPVIRVDDNPMTPAPKGN